MTATATAAQMKTLVLIWENANKVAGFVYDTTHGPRHIPVRASKADIEALGMIKLHANSISSLLSKGLVEEVVIGTLWDGFNLTALVLTPAGAAAIGVELAPAADEVAQEEDTEQADEDAAAQQLVSTGSYAARIAHAGISRADRVYTGMETARYATAQEAYDAALKAVQAHGWANRLIVTQGRLDPYNGISYQTIVAQYDFDCTTWTITASDVDQDIDISTDEETNTMIKSIIVQGLDRAPLIARTIAYLESAPDEAVPQVIAVSGRGPESLAAVLRELSIGSSERALMDWWGVCAQVMGAAGPGAAGAQRLLTDEEDAAVTQAVYTALRASRQGAAAELVEDIVRTTLYPLGLFRSAGAPEPDSCTAMELALSPDEPNIHGVWSQCELEPGHDGDHDGDFGSWSEKGAWNTVAPEA